MGRNFHSVCHSCKVQLMHLRGKEGSNMHRFANDHPEGSCTTEIINDYIAEPPEEYDDVFDEYNPNWESKLKSRKGRV